MGWSIGTLGENIISTSADSSENLHNHIFNSRANGSEARFHNFFPLYRKEGYAGCGK
jgi:hypothetical protein